MDRSTTSPCLLIVTLTSPPPALPSISVSASSCCALISWLCTCAAAAKSCCISSCPPGSMPSTCLLAWPGAARLCITATESLRPASSPDTLAGQDRRGLQGGDFPHPPPPHVPHHPIPPLHVHPLTPP